MTPEQIELLEKRYEWTWYELGLETDWRPHWLKLVDAYSASGRVYHDLRHVFEMVEWLCKYAPYTSTLLALLLWSAFYHDYENPKSLSAEEDSAARAMEIYFVNICAEHVKSGASLVGGQVIQNCILGTKGHVSHNTLVQWVIDADLQRFRCQDDRYALMIREEYAEHPDSVFNPGRIAVLEKYAARTPFFYHSDGEDEAAKSIQRQLQEARNQMNQEQK